MGRKEAVSGVVICLAVALLQVVWQPKKREMDVISSVSMNNGDQIREYIVVLLNGFSGYSEEEIQKEILKKYDENTFNSIRFNQGLSELDGLQVDVYEDKTGYQNGEKIFNFEYPEK